MSAAVTQWFHGEKPARPGVYESGTRQTDGSIVGGLYQHWNTHFWGITGDTPEEAYDNRKWLSTLNEPWRGLARKPRSRK